MFDFASVEKILSIVGAVLVSALAAIAWWQVVGKRVNAIWRGWCNLPVLWKIVLPVVFGAFVLHGSGKSDGVGESGSEGEIFSRVEGGEIVAKSAKENPSHRYHSPTNYAADLSVFNRPTNAVTPRLWTKYSIVDDFQLVPGGRIAGVCGAVTTQPWGIDTPDRIWGDIEFTYGNVPTGGFASFVKLKDKTLDLTGYVVPNRTVKVEKNFEQDTEWWLENYPEICYTNAVGDLVFDYDTNEWIYIEFTFGATEPMAEYSKALNEYRSRVAEALGYHTLERDGTYCLVNFTFGGGYLKDSEYAKETYYGIVPSNDPYLVNLEYAFDKYDKDSMSPELLKKYETQFNTVTNIRDAAVVEYVSFIWDDKKGLEAYDDFESMKSQNVDFKKFPSPHYYQDKSNAKFITPSGVYIENIDEYIDAGHPEYAEDKIIISKKWGDDSGTRTNYYKVVYYDPYLVKNVLGPRPKLQDFYKRLSPYLVKKDGDIISPEFYMDFPLGKFVWLYYKDSLRCVKNDKDNDDEDYNIGAFCRSVMFIRLWQKPHARV